MAVDAPAVTAQLLRHHDDQTAEHPDRAKLRIPAAPRPADPHRPAGTWPPRGTDPVSVDGYQVVSRLGAGGMAEVFSAVAPAGGPVAVKILRAAAGVPRHAGGSTGWRTPWTRTAPHPHSATACRRPGRSMSAARLWTFGSTLAGVLAAVHGRGVHCDVKPSNLLVRDHDVRLIDFGIARYVWHNGRIIVQTDVNAEWTQR